MFIAILVVSSVSYNSLSAARCVSLLDEEDNKSVRAPADSPGIEEQLQLKIMISGGCDVTTQAGLARPG